MPIARGLIIDTRWIDLILTEKKDWEMRHRRINFRERIALIRKGTQTVAGVADIVDVIGPLNDAQLLSSIDHHGVPADEIELLCRRRFAWVLTNVMPLKTPIPYVHRNGQEVWVRLDDQCIRSLGEVLRHTDVHELTVNVR